MALLLLTGHAQAGPSWGGAATVTSDYLLRGVSPSDDQPALQLDVHYVNPTGLFAGVFASDSAFKALRQSYAEVDPYAGYAWDINDDWRGKLWADAYLYPANPAGPHYQYEEVALAADYHDWLTLETTVSPNAPRASLYQGLLQVSEVSADVSAQRLVYGRLSATGGVGLSHVDGTATINYVYWSVGSRYDVSPLSLTFTYVGTSGAAKHLLYNGTGGGRWVGTVIFRF